MNKTVAYVLQGRNAGAELEILPGKWTFGSSESAWFCFEDASVKDIHFEIELVSDSDKNSSGETQLLPSGYFGNGADPDDGAGSGNGADPDNDAGSGNGAGSGNSGNRVSAPDSDGITDATDGSQSVTSDEEVSDEQADSDERSSARTNQLEPGLYLRPVNGKVKLNGEMVSSEIVISEGDVLSFGLNELIFSPPGTSFEQLLAIAEEVRARGIERKVNAAVDELRARLEQEFQEKLLAASAAQEADKSGSAEHDDAPPEGPVEDQEPAKADKRRLLGPSTLILAGTALAGASILAVLLFMLIFKDPMADSNDNERTIREYLAENNVSDIVISRNQGYLQVSGTVSSYRHREKVLASLPEVDEVMVLKIKTHQTMLEDVRRAFASRGASVKVIRTTDQHLHIFGYVQDPVMEGSLMSSVKEILTGDVSLLNAVDKDSIAARTDRGTVISDDLVMEPHFIYENEIKDLLEQLNRENGLNLKYIFAPLDVAYISPVKLESDRRFININRKLAKSINAPVELISIPDLTYKYTLLKSSLASGKGTALQDGDYLASRVAQAALGTGHSSLLDSYQRALDLLSPYNRRIMEQAGAVSAANAIPVPNDQVNKEATEEPLKQFNNIFGNTEDPDSADSSFSLPEGVIIDAETADYSEHASTDAENVTKESDSAQAALASDDNKTSEAKTAASDSKTKTAPAEKTYDIVSITMKPLRFITMRDGTKIFEGGNMPGGARLKRITVNYLILVNAKGKEVRYELK